MANMGQFLIHPWELIASLWDFPPPTTLPAALPSGVPLASAAAGAADASLHTAVGGVASGGFCGWASSEAGSAASRSFVCHALGLTMPAVVFFTSAALFLITVLFLIRYLIRARSALRAMEILERQMDKHSESTPFSWPTQSRSKQVVATLVEGSRRLPPLAVIGKRIEDAVIAWPWPGPETPEFPEFKEKQGQPPEERAVVLNRSVHEISGNRRGLDVWTGKQLADELPAWLSAVGLLTTFLAILLGLKGVQVSSDLEVTGIAGLVNGLSGKFCSSIVALGCAVTVSIVNHFVGNRLHDDWGSILQRLERILPHLSTERMLAELLRRQKNQA